MMPGKQLVDSRPGKRASALGALLTLAVIVFGVSTYRLYNSEAATSAQPAAAQSQNSPLIIWIVIATLLLLFIAGIVLGVRWVMSRRLENSPTGGRPSDTDMA